MMLIMLMAGRLYVYQWLFLSPYNNQDREEGWEWGCASVDQLQVESPLSTPGGHDHDGDEDDHDGDDGEGDGDGEKDEEKDYNGDGGDYLSWFDIPGSNNTAAMLLFGVNHLERGKGKYGFGKKPLRPPS